MKKIIYQLAIVMVFFVVAAVSALAQESNDGEMKTLFKKSEKGRVHGGYGGITLSYSQLGDRDALNIGAKGGWIVDHKWVLGIAGAGFMSDPKFDVALDREYELSGGYGGLLFEPIIGWDKPVHVSFPIMVGAGGIAYITHWEDYDPHNDESDFEDYYEDSDAFFIVEPGVEVEFNMLKFFRVALGVSYKFTSNVDLRYSSGMLDATTGEVSALAGQRIIEKDVLNGLNFGMTFKFGKF